jgi:hypothetical protein
MTKDKPPLLVFHAFAGVNNVLLELHMFGFATLHASV